MTDKLIVISDLHIVAPGDRIIGIDPAARLRQALDHALATHPDASCILLLGDLTHHGLPAEYAHLRDILAPVPIPVHMTLGNHDRRDAFDAVFPGRMDANGFICSSVPLRGATLVICDTLDGPPYDDRHHAGRLCPERLRWLDTALSGTDRAILALHHPPAPVLMPGMDAIGLANGAELLDLVDRHPSVAQMIFGHIHRTISGQMRGHPFAIFKSPCHQMPMDMTSRSTSLSVAEPGAYGIVCVTKTCIIVHSEDFTLDPPLIDDPHSA
ncbi:hypothetical protein ATO11_06960 [Pseudaestuariivita atlantica]|uniref:Calcineurin-like phosphoesterase domain-containing protein n=2 Tax=Pseudaestuariivita atlantica TaxID=1317121 RepID=A0A0L1JRI9_9RHOB|nr:hypothetical protein ATO11_06960 [Pseudaestuariivita atlantica]